MRTFFVALLSVAATGTCVLSGVWLQSRGVHVTVINRGPESLSNVVVHVTGNHHPIGNLAVGESRTVRVSPTSESGVELAFVDQLGQPHRLDAGGYFEGSGYQGTIEVELEGGAVKRKEQNIELSPF